MKVRILDTIIFNIRAFGWKRGWHLPVFLFSKVKVYSMGKMEITCPLRHNIVSIGMNASDTATTHSIWNNHGVIRIAGKVYIHQGCIINNYGEISIGGNNIIGYDVRMDIHQALYIGNHAFIGFRSEVTDTDHHYTIDTNTRTIHTCSAPIHIGNYNWFGNHTYIKKGTITPDFTIVASPNALLCKDYSDMAPYSVLGGAPAKVIKQGIRRIYNFQHEAEISQYFASHPQEKNLVLDDSIDLDTYCQFNESSIYHS